MVHVRLFADGGSLTEDVIADGFLCEVPQVGDLIAFDTLGAHYRVVSRLFILAKEDTGKADVALAVRENANGPE